MVYILQGSNQIEFVIVIETEFRIYLFETHLTHLSRGAHKLFPLLKSWLQNFLMPLANKWRCPY